MKLWKTRIGYPLTLAALALGPAWPVLAHAEDGDGVGGFGGMMGGWWPWGAWWMWLLPALLLVLVVLGIVVLVRDLLSPRAGATAKTDEPKK